MYKSKYILILAISTLIGFTGCLEDNNKALYTIEGTLIDGTNPSNKFSFRHLKFKNTINHKDIVLLGEATTDANGYFKMSYEFDKNYHINFMRIEVDSNFIAANKLNSIEIGSNWNIMFYLGDSANIDLYINAPLGQNDTLFFNNWDSLFTVVGPFPTGYVKRLKCLNYNQFGLIGYAVGWNNYLRATKVTGFIPTGEPIVDELHLNLIN